MHSCAIPFVIEQRLPHSVHITGFNPTGDDFYKRRRVDYEDGGSITQEYDFSYQSALQDVVYNETITGPTTGDAEVSYSGGFTTDQAREEGMAHLLANFAWDEADPLKPWWSSCGIYYDPYAEATFGPTYLKALTLHAVVFASSCGVYLGYVTFARFRWRVPMLVDPVKRYPYFKITWDTVFFPSGGGSPTVITADQTWENILDADVEDEGYYSPYYEITPSAEEGVVRVVNVRWICYRGEKLGSKPNVEGESFEPPP
jgi:hypothetical protein